MKIFNKIILSIGLIVLTSCGGSKDLVYLKGISDTAAIDSVFTRPLVIKSGDQLSISLSSLNSEADAIINQSNSGGGAANSVGTSGANVVGYFVSENGTINMPRLGSIYASSDVGAIYKEPNCKCTIAQLPNYGTWRSHSTWTNHNHDATSRYLTGNWISWRYYTIW